MKGLDAAETAVKPLIGPPLAKFFAQVSNPSSAASTGPMIKPIPGLSPFFRHSQPINIFLPFPAFFQIFTISIFFAIFEKISVERFELILMIFARFWEILFLPNFRDILAFY